MKKAKRSFNTTPNKANSIIGRLDFTHKGFALDHEERSVYVLERTDIEIRRGNEELLDKFIEITRKHPNYSCSVLHIMFAH